MTTPLVSVSDGPRTTVADLVGNPYLIPARTIDSLARTDIVPTLLRDAGGNTNGLVSFRQSNPLYLGRDVEDMAEFAEIPVAAGQIGLPRIAYATRRALGVRVSEDMRRENNIDAVNLQITQLVNTMIRARVRVLRKILSDPTVPTIAASIAWTGAGSKPRRDLANAAEAVGSAKPFPTGGEDDDVFGFEADTAVFPRSIVPVLMDNEDFLKVYKDSMSERSINYTGVLENDVLGMLALTTRSWPQDRVLVLERRTLGFFSDTRPLTSTPLYPEGGGGMGGPTESWRTDTSEKRVTGIDQPLAACWITGIR
jgi:hypothetical protein